MPAILGWITERRPWHVFVCVSLLSLLTAPLAASVDHPAVSSLGALIGLLLFFGYPTLIIFGFPERYSTSFRRRIALAPIAIVLLLVVADSIGGSHGRAGTPEWVNVAFGIPLVALLYAPFFIATSVIGEARRTVGHYKPMDCIGTWVCVVTYPVLGVFFIQRSVFSVLTAIAELDTVTSGLHRP